MLRPELQSKIVKGTALLFAASLCLEGCADSGPDVQNEIKECGDTYVHQIDASNVQPTYLKSEPHYSPATDPYILYKYQKKHSKGFDYIGLRSLVCNQVEDKNWDNTTTKQRQVLTQVGVAIAAKLDGTAKS